MTTHSTITPDLLDHRRAIWIASGLGQDKAVLVRTDIVFLLQERRISRRDVQSGGLLTISVDFGNSSFQSFISGSCRSRSRSMASSWPQAIAETRAITISNVS